MSMEGMKGENGGSKSLNMGGYKGGKGPPVEQ